MLALPPPNQIGFTFLGVDPDADVFKLTGELPLVGAIDRFGKSIIGES